jgi:ribose transport system ATP-binding protein
MENGKILKVLDRKEFSTEKVRPYAKDFNDFRKPSTGKEHKEEALQFENVYTDNLKCLNFTIEKGECAVLLDMNNTILQDIIEIMNGEQTLKGGRIYLNNEPYLQKDAHRAYLRPLPARHHHRPGR